MITDDLQPFSVVEDTGFKSLINLLAPQYKLPCRQTFVTQMSKSHSVLKSELMNELKHVRYVALTTDGWTPKNKPISYNTFTVHYKLKGN